MNNAATVGQPPPWKADEGLRMLRSTTPDETIEAIKFLVTRGLSIEHKPITH